MVKSLRQIAREWGRTHALLDALGIGRHGAALPARLSQLLRQLVGGAKIKSIPPPKGLVTFDKDETIGKEPAKASKRKKRRR
jgi:hypothetical protein